MKINAVFGGAPGGSAEPRGASGSGFGYGPHLLDEMTTTTVVHLEAAPRRTTTSSVDPATAGSHDTDTATAEDVR